MKTKDVIKFGQALYAPFTIEIFDSRNTSFMAKETFSNERDAKLFAKFKSVPHKAVLHDSKKNWLTYENGVVTEWSVNDARPDYGISTINALKRMK